MVPALITPGFMMSLCIRTGFDPNQTSCRLSGLRFLPVRHRAARVPWQQPALNPLRRGLDAVRAAEGGLRRHWGRIDFMRSATFAALGLLVLTASAARADDLMTGARTIFKPIPATAPVLRDN